VVKVTMHHQKLSGILSNISSLQSAPSYVWYTCDKRVIRG
jgi:hypothetical protein